MIMIPLMEYAKDLLELRLIIYGALMIFVMILYPKGLVGVLDALMNAFRRRKETHKGTPVSLR